MADPSLIIPLLEPLAGSGLAVSLAYLALERFRYRDAVERYAKDKSGRLRNEDESDTVEVVKDLQWLCRDDCNGHTPRGLWANLYHYSFRNKADEFLISVLACISGLTLVSGVAMNVGLWSWVSIFEARWISTLLFYSCFAALLIPASSVLFGRKCVSWCREFADHCEDEITKIHRRSARSASVPTLPRGTDQGEAERAMRRSLWEAQRRKRDRPPE